MTPAAMILQAAAIASPPAVSKGAAGGCQWLTENGGWNDCGCEVIAFHASTTLRYCARHAAQISAMGLRLEVLPTKELGAEKSPQHSACHW